MSQLASLLYVILAQTPQGNVNGNSLPKANIAPSLQTTLPLVFIAMTLISIIFIAIGGLKYVLSSGDPQAAAKAKNTILYAVIGLIIGVFAFTIVGFVGSRI